MNYLITFESPEGTYELNGGMINGLFTNKHGVSVVLTTAGPIASTEPIGKLREKINKYCADTIENLIKLRKDNDQNDNLTNPFKQN